jgi:hypothetical protein
MLRDKDRMPAHGRLFTIIIGQRGRQPSGDKICRVLIDGPGAFIPAVLPLFGPQAKTGAERRTCQPGKERR